MKFYLILHFPSTVGQQPTCHFRNIEVESNDRHLESFDVLGSGRWILKAMSFPSLTAKRWQSIVPYFSQILTFFSLNLCNNISLGTWQTLLHGKPCLIPIFITVFTPTIHDRIYEQNRCDQDLASSKHHLPIITHPSNHIIIIYGMSVKMKFRARLFKASLA